MTFTLAAFCYIVALILSCFLIFFSILQVRAFYVLKLKQFDENTYIFLYILLNLIVLPDYISHVSLTLLFLCSGEWLTFLLNVPLVAYHVYRYKNRPSSDFYNAFTMLRSWNQDYALWEGVCKAVFYVVSFSYYLVCTDYAITNYCQKI